jgi:hypothetical protein
VHFEFPIAFPSARWSHSTQTWTKLGGKHLDPQREDGISLLLPLRPPHHPPRVLIAGGGHKRHKTAQATAERIDLSAPDPRWSTAGTMHFARIYANGVLLPDGKVLVVGGKTGETGHPHGPPTAPQAPGGDPHAVHAAELYDPDTNTWTPLAAQTRDRIYHSTALLLPDGRVISMGGNPRPKVIEHSIEIYSPPYLFRGERPVLTTVPEHVGYGRPFTVTVDRARQIGQVVIMRPEVLTHQANTDQRLLEVTFKVLGDDKLEVQAPASPAHMPPGYALLFVLNDADVPSVGRFIRVG